MNYGIFFIFHAVFFFYFFSLVRKRNFKILLHFSFILLSFRMCVTMTVMYWYSQMTTVTINNLKYIHFTFRHSDELIPSIIKFLFYLTKQREKKLISIPKIINITDTLLANNAAVKCSTLALNELAYEFFFKQLEGIVQPEYGPPVANTNTTIDGGGLSDNSELTSKDISTQKEVAFSMLIKFLDSIEVRTFCVSIWTVFFFFC